MFDTLVHRQDGHIPGAPEPTVVEELLQRAQYLRAAVGVEPHALQEIGAGEVKLVLRNGRARVLQEVAGLIAEHVGDTGGGCGHDVCRLQVVW